MMKKRILAVLLALAMLTTTCAGVFAETKDVEETNPLSKYTEGTGYVAFGDSITRGYVASDKWIDEGLRMDEIPINQSYVGQVENLNDLTGEAYQKEFNNKTASVFCRNVTGSYTKKIADKLGCYSPDNITFKNSNYWPISQCAITTDMIVDLLGIENQFIDEDMVIAKDRIHKRYDASLYYFGSKGNSYQINGTDKYQQDPVSEDIRTLVDNAGLITIGLGMGEVLNRANWLAQDAYSAGGQISDYATEFVRRMYEGYNNFTEQYPLLLDYLKKNSHATVVLIGALNPLYGMTLTDETIIPVGNAASAITMLMNQRYKEWAEEYGFIYLDISNVETGTVENDTDFITFMNKGDDEIFQGIATHPTEKGYTQIARMVLNALEEKDKDPKTNVDNIVVDLGRYQNLHYVMLNGKFLSSDEYSIENYKLTIPCTCTNKKNLTIAVITEDLKLAVTSYKLNYHDGYVVYRVLQTNDAVKTVSKPLILMKKGLDRLIDLFKK